MIEYTEPPSLADEIEARKLSRGPTKLLATTDLRIVSMIAFNDKIYLATEHGVFFHDPKKGDLNFEQMQLVEVPCDLP